MKRAVLVFALCATGCSSGRTEIAINYQLTGINLADLVRVETYVSVDPSSDNRSFFADQPYRSVATGVGYEVGDFDHSGERRLLITHDETLGFQFTPTFTFTLLPPAGETPPPLVVTARAVGASTTIGQTAQLKTRFAVNAKLAVPLTDQRCGGVVCGSDKMCCSNQCTNVLSDASHCGSCSLACAPTGDSCSGGSCACGGGSACASGKTCCPLMGCLDLQTDPFNCGACGHACNPGESCAAGVCKCNGGPACGTSGLCCAGTGCSSTGSCPCGSTQCGSPKTCCGNAACVNLMTDNSNCGGCGNLCNKPLSCTNGACACNGASCSSGDTCCSSGCANLMTSTANCGACNHACNTNETCTGGQCQCGGGPACATGQSCCGTSCANTQTDTSNCGSCGHRCNAGEQCLSGACVCPGTNPPRACTTSETCCASVNGSTPGCFNTSSSNSNCGACGVACTATQTCTMGKCVQTSCSPSCTNGNTCNTSVQPPQCQCGNSGACGTGQYCCNGACTNLLTDPLNCGKCGVSCGGQVCCAGSCCTGGDLCCPSVSSTGNVLSCIPQSTSNCGRCGNVCGTVITDAGAAYKESCCVCNNQPGTCGLTCPLCPVSGP